MTESLAELKAKNIFLKKKRRNLLAKIKRYYFLDWVKTDAKIKQLRKEIYERTR